MLQCEQVLIETSQGHCLQLLVTLASPACSLFSLTSLLFRGHFSLLFCFFVFCAAVPVSCVCTLLALVFCGLLTCCFSFFVFCW